MHHSIGMQHETRERRLVDLRRRMYQRMPSKLPEGLQGEGLLPTLRRQVTNHPHSSLKLSVAIIESFRRSCRRCVKICEATVVNSISAAQSLTGCTHINGSLHLHITDQSVAGELEKSLDHIEQISGYLKVAFSSALTNLTFFSNLRIINGTSLENGR